MADDRRNARSGLAAPKYSNGGRGSVRGRGSVTGRGGHGHTPSRGGLAGNPFVVNQQSSDKAEASRSSDGPKSTPHPVSKNTPAFTSVFGHAKKASAVSGERATKGNETTSGPTDVAALAEQVRSLTSHVQTLQANFEALEIASKMNTTTKPSNDTITTKTLAAAESQSFENSTEPFRHVFGDYVLEIKRMNPALAPKEKAKEAKSAVAELMPPPRGVKDPFKVSTATQPMPVLRAPQTGLQTPSHIPNTPRPQSSGVTQVPESPRTKTAMTSKPFSEKTWFGVPETTSTATTYKGHIRAKSDLGRVPATQAVSLSQATGILQAQSARTGTATGSSVAADATQFPRPGTVASAVSAANSGAAQTQTSQAGMPSQTQVSGSALVQASPPTSGTDTGAAPGGGVSLAPQPGAQISGAQVTGTQSSPQAQPSRSSPTTGAITSATGAPTLQHSRPCPGPVAGSFEGIATTPQHSRNWPGIGTTPQRSRRQNQNQNQNRQNQSRENQGRTSQTPSPLVPLEQRAEKGMGSLPKTELDKVKASLAKSRWAPGGGT